MSRFPRSYLRPGCPVAQAGHPYRIQDSLVRHNELQIAVFFLAGAAARQAGLEPPAKLAARWFRCGTLILQHAVRLLPTALLHLFIGVLTDYCSKVFQFSSSCHSSHEVAVRNVPAAQVRSTAFGFRVWKGGVEQRLCLAHHSLHARSVGMSIDALTALVRSMASAAEPAVHVPGGRLRRAKWCIQGRKSVAALAQPETSSVLGNVRLIEAMGLEQPSRNCGSLQLFVQRLSVTVPASVNAAFYSDRTKLIRVILLVGLHGRLMISGK